MEDEEVLPAELVEHIMVRLPAMSLIRFQTVSTTWFNKIQEIEFKNEHAMLQHDTNNPLQLLEVKMGALCDVGKISADVDAGLTPLWMPAGGLGTDGHLGGSCNGLVCIEVRGQITVFNPVTQEVRYVPRPFFLNQNEPERRIQTEFFFHSATGKYNISIVLEASVISPNFNWVHMFTLGGNSTTRNWRCVCSSRLFPVSHGVNVEDTIYWLVNSEANDTDIISLDLNSTEETISYWKSPVQDSRLIGLTKWNDGKLCGLSIHTGNDTLNFWTLDSKSPDAGMIYTVRYRCHLDNVGRGLRLLTPCSVQINNRVYFVDQAVNTDLIRYDISTNTRHNAINFRFMWGSNRWEIVSCFSYEETLIPVPPVV